MQGRVWKVEGYRMSEEEGKSGDRESKDKKMNSEGRRLCKFIGERGWHIMNGCTKGDEQGEWTYMDRTGTSVIDYVLGHEDTREMVDRLVVEDRIDSAHQPITIWIKGAE